MSNSIGQSLSRSDKRSWKMFRGSPMRTGVSSSAICHKPSLLWVTQIGPVVSSPVFENWIIYICTITGRIFAINSFKKQIKWHSNVGSPLVSSPLIHDDILVAATYDSWVKDTSFARKNFVLGISAGDGRLLWRYEISGDVFSSPCLVDDSVIVLGSVNKAIYAIDCNSGNVRWIFETGGEIWSSPSYNGNEIFVGSDDGFLYCLDIDGKLLWKVKLNGKIRSSTPCLSNDYGDEDRSPSIFIGTYSGGMFCLSQSTGLIKWSKHISKPVMASPTAVKGKVFFATSDNRIYSFQIKDGSKIWDFETADRIWSSPCLSLSGSTIFFGSLDSHIYGIDINTGRQNWKFPTMNMVDSSPVIAEGMMFIASRDGLLYIFGSLPRPPYIE